MAKENFRHPVTMLSQIREYLKERCDVRYIGEKVQNHPLGNEAPYIKTGQTFHLFFAPTWRWTPPEAMNDWLKKMSEELPFIRASHQPASINSDGDYNLARLVYEEPIGTKTITVDSFYTPTYPNDPETYVYTEQPTKEFQIQVNRRIEMRPYPTTAAGVAVMKYEVAKQSGLIIRENEDLESAYYTLIKSVFDIINSSSDYFFG